jgi:polysaccharide deacetylase family protein (PEP-CTERM system associated)
MRPNPALPAFFTVDVEEWYQPAVMERYVPRARWGNQPLRLQEGLHIISELLDKHEVKATFFCLSDLPKTHHALLRSLSDKGHEIASHGHTHRSFTGLTSKEIREELMLSRSILEDITGKQVQGFRAPNFSITDETVDLLVETGYRYDSSLFKVRLHRGYGRLDRYPVQPTPYMIHPELMEFPLSVLPWGFWQIPWAGGAYFRHFPRSIFLAGVQELVRSGYYHFYIHPWELDTTQPHPKHMRWIDRLRHFRNISRSGKMIESMLSKHSFSSIGQHLEAVATSPIGQFSVA